MSLSLRLLLVHWNKGNIYPSSHNVSSDPMEVQRQTNVAADYRQFINTTKKMRTCFHTKRRVIFLCFSVTTLFLSVYFYAPRLSPMSMTSGSRRRLTVVTDHERGVERDAITIRIMRNVSKTTTNKGVYDVKAYEFDDNTRDKAASFDAERRAGYDAIAASLRRKKEEQSLTISPRTTTTTAASVFSRNGQSQSSLNSYASDETEEIYDGAGLGPGAEHSTERGRNNNAVGGGGDAVASGRNRAGGASSSKTVNRTTALSNERQCHPHHNVVFWKTHKCASSTTQNLMLRHAAMNDLRVALPARTHLFDLIRRFNVTRDMPKEFIKRDRPFNIFTHHARFNYQDVSSIMPANSIYVTIVRSPSTLFESIYTYLELPKYFADNKGRVNIIRFLKNPRKFYNPLDLTVHRRYARNPLLYDLGLEPTDMDRTSRVADTILEVQLRFHLVLIAEYFDESLILLKDLLCWDFEDVAYLKLNAREKARPMSAYAQKLLQKWNEGDMHLYQYFNDTFWKRVEKYGYARMERDVRTLRALNLRLMERCVEEVTNTEDIDDQVTYWHPDGVDIIAYRLKQSAQNDQTCRDVTKPETLFTEEIRGRQGDYYFPPMKEDDALLKWWHIKDESERKVAKVLGAMAEGMRLPAKPPGG